jgi:hypothetical protein
VVERSCIMRPAMVLGKENVPNNVHVDERRYAVCSIIAVGWVSGNIYDIEDCCVNVQVAIV